MAPSAIFYLFSFRSSVLTKIEGYFNFYTCEMMIFCEQNLICATLKLRPNSLPRPQGLQFICLERKTLLDGVAKWIVSVYLTSILHSTPLSSLSGFSGFELALSDLNPPKNPFQTSNKASPALSTFWAAAYKGTMSYKIQGTLVVLMVHASINLSILRPPH